MFWENVSNKYDDYGGMILYDALLLTVFFLFHTQKKVYGKW